MNILFRHKNPLKSTEFNQRFADAVGGSILHGFLFRKGTGELDISLYAESPENSLLITESGVRIETDGPLEDVITLTPNAYPLIRIDTIYAKYIHGTRDAIVEYLCIEGGIDGTPAYVESTDTHVLLGYIHLAPNATDLFGATFEYPNRGLKLRDVANEAKFKATATFDEGVLLPEPTDDSHGANKGYVDGKLIDEGESFPVATVTSNLYDSANGVFEGVTYRRKDGTIYMQSQLGGVDGAGRFTTITLSRFASDGITEVDVEEWRLTYNEFGKITSKVRV